MTKQIPWLLFGILVGLIIGMLVGVAIATNALGVDIRFPWEAIPIYEGGYIA